MGPDNEDFFVEDLTPELYNLNKAIPPIWEPQTAEVLAMFQMLQSGQVLPLKWKCPGRHAPKSEVVLLHCINTCDKSADHVETGNETTRDPEPSAFDFDDTVSETSSKVRMTPRTSVFCKSKQPEKRVARMDNVLNSIKRQQKAEREARKSHQGSNVLRSIKSAAAGSPCQQNPGSPLPSSPRPSLSANGEFVSSGTCSETTVVSALTTASQSGIRSETTVLSASLTFSSITALKAVPSCIMSEAPSYIKPFSPSSENENFSSQPAAVELGSNIKEDN